MSDAKDFRPHLNSKEIRYLLELVKFAEGFLTIQEERYKKLELKRYRLGREVRIGNTSVWRELKAVKEQLNDARGLPMRILQQRIMLRYLKRRFESILNGGKAHRHSGYDHSLDHALEDL